MLTTYISKSGLASRVKSKDNYLSEASSKVLLSIFEESIITKNFSSVSKYLKLIKELKNDKKESYFYGILKKYNPNIAYDILPVIYFLENIEKIINEGKGLFKFYKNLEKFKNALPNAFDKLIKMIIAAILTSLEKSSQEIPINNFAKCFDEGKTGNIQSILIILVIERKKCRIFKKEGLRMVFGNEIEDSEYIDLYLSSNEEKLSLIHFDNSFANFEGYYLKKELPKSIFTDGKLASKILKKPKNGKIECEELLKIFYKKCFKKALSKLKKDNSIDDVIFDLNAYKKVFYKQNKELIKKFEEMKIFDRKIEEFLQAIEDTEGSIKKIENLKKVLIR